jgi:hypothetical protein
MKLSQVRSGYARLGQFWSVYVRLVLVMSGYSG